MVKKDVTAQWLMGNKLKIDQLCFLFDVITIIRRSPLKEKLDAQDHNIVENIIPMLACFEAILNIRIILKMQLDEKKKALKKGTLVIEETKKTQEEKDEALIEEELKNTDELDIDQYGRKWIWDTYISEGYKGEWMQAAELLRQINDHVIQDIRDYILIQGFDPKIQKDRKMIAKKVETLLVDSEKGKNKDGKDQIDSLKKKRDFELQLRPPFVWNFFETRIDKEEQMKLKSKFISK